MKTTHGAFLLMLSLAVSCKEISFREPQPVGRRDLTAVPRKLQGKYFTLNEDGTPSGDTVIITARGYRFGYSDENLSAVKTPANHDHGVLSDSVVLRAYKGYYFLNLYEDPEWLLRVLRMEANGDLTYMAMEQEEVDFKDYVRKLSTEIRIDSIRVKDETLYHIDPTPSQLVELIGKGYFSKTILKKIP